MKKYYTLSQVILKFFPNSAECICCTRLEFKNEMVTCPHCKKLVCKGVCYWDHTLGCFG